MLFCFVSASCHYQHIRNREHSASGCDESHHETIHLPGGFPRRPSWNWRELYGHETVLDRFYPLRSAMECFWKQKGLFESQICAHVTSLFERRMLRASSRQEINSSCPNPGISVEMRNYSKHKKHGIQRFHHYFESWTNLQDGELIWKRNG